MSMKQLSLDETVVPFHLLGSFLEWGGRRRSILNALGTWLISYYFQSNWRPGPLDLPSFQSDFDLTLKVNNTWAHYWSFWIRFNGNGLENLVFWGQARSIYFHLKRILILCWNWTFFGTHFDHFGRHSMGMSQKILHFRTRFNRLSFISVEFWCCIEIEHFLLNFTIFDQIERESVGKFCILGPGSIGSIFISVEFWCYVEIEHFLDPIWLFLTKLNVKALDFLHFRTRSSLSIGLDFNRILMPC